MKKAAATSEIPLRLPKSHRQAFSIVELMVVIAVIAIVASFVVPAMRNVMSGTEVNQAEQLVIQQLSHARLLAMARNRRVEVRLYTYIDPGDGNPAQLYRGLQAFVIEEDNSATPVGKVAKLPGNIAINSNSTLSSLMTRPDKTFSPPEDPKIGLPGIGVGYSAKALQFRPNGSTNLSSTGKWFLTLVSTVPYGQESSATLPTNFATIQIDPVGGSVRSYRP